MVEIKKAEEKDIKTIQDLDWVKERSDFLAKSVRFGQCWLARIENKTVGFVIFDQSFFENTFVKLLIVHEDYRRKGVGTALMRHVEKICLTEKLFTSTNESNIPAQKLYESLGFVKSGFVENLDDDDLEIFYFKKLDAIDRK